MFCCALKTQTDASTKPNAWTYFDASNVTAYSCGVSRVQMAQIGGPSREVWEAVANAKRKEESDWGMTVGEFPPTDKGLRQATAACDKWVIEAAKQVRASKAK